MKRTLIVPALLLTIATAGTPLGAAEWDRRDRDRNDRYDRRDDRYSRSDPYYRNDPYYGNDRYGRDRRNDPYYGNDRYGRDRRNDGYYGNDGRYGQNRSAYGRDAGAVASRVLSDLRTAASSNYNVDKEKRDHFRKAQEELMKFMNRYQSGRFETGNLDKAIEKLEKLSNSDQIRSRDRQILANGMWALREVRANRDSYRSGNYSNRQGPFGNIF